MRILLLGSGGREHALAWKISQSPRCSQLFIAPGNAGTASVGTNVPELKPVDFAAVEAFVRQEQVDMVVVGPEDPLVRGIVDYFGEHLPGVAIIGPSAAGAQMEGSKDFAKEFMMRHAIPTARHQTFDGLHAEEGCQFLATLQPPYVLKADGLCAGKGVLIISEGSEGELPGETPLAHAQRELRDMLGGMFGTASSRVVVEEFLDGIECSVFALTDGEHYQLLPEAKDYKRIGEGDTGLNTGGMGSVSPVPFATPAWMQKVEDEIVRPTVEGLREEGIDYKGFIFFGLINCGGQPKVIEYNCRMGDPETETVMLRLGSDIVDLFEGVATGTLDERQVTFDPRAAVCVMCVSEGYPGSYPKGLPMEVETEAFAPDQVVFHAGTALRDGQLTTNGGRVIAVSSYGTTQAEALARSMEGVRHISYHGKYYRRDIGQDLL